MGRGLSHRSVEHHDPEIERMRIWRRANGLRPRLSHYWTAGAGLRRGDLAVDLAVDPGGALA